MIYRARTGTKVKVAANIVWPTECYKEFYADRIATLGSNTWRVDMSVGDSVIIKVGDDFMVIPKFALDRAA